MKGWNLPTNEGIWSLFLGQLFSWWNSLLWPSAARSHSLTRAEEVVHTDVSSSSQQVRLIPFLLCLSLSVLHCVFLWGFPANILYTFLVPYISCWSQPGRFSLQEHYGVTIGKYEMALIRCYLWLIREHIGSVFDCLLNLIALNEHHCQFRCIGVRVGPQLLLPPSYTV